MKGLVNVARNGYLWQLERTKDKINFVDGQPYVRQNVFKRLDPKTGRPDIDETRKPGTGKTAEFCPSLWGGKDWPPVAYSPQTRMLYIPANDNLCTELTGETAEIRAGRALHGRGEERDEDGRRRRPHRRAAGVGYRHRKEGVDDKSAVVQLGSGARHRRRAPVRGRHQRPHVPRLRRQDRQDPVGVPDRSGVAAVPVSFQVDGKQYIAVQSGWGVDPAKMQARMNLIFPGQYPEVPQGGTIWVFAVK